MSGEAAGGGGAGQAGGLLGLPAQEAVDGVFVDGQTVQGALLKWTNYVHGWQSRWFVLARGVLSYYGSRDEVALGCRGSLAIASAQIKVSPSDKRGFEILVENEQHLYLRTESPRQRQHWLVALGSRKLESLSAAATPVRARSPVPETPEAAQNVRQAVRRLRNIRRALVAQTTSLQARVQTIAATDIEELRTEVAKKLGRDAARATDSCSQLMGALRDLAQLVPALDAGPDSPPGRGSPTVSAYSASPPGSCPSDAGAAGSKRRSLHFPTGIPGTPTTTSPTAASISPAAWDLASPNGDARQQRTPAEKPPQPQPPPAPHSEPPPAGTTPRLAVPAPGSGATTDDDVFVDSRSSLPDARVGALAGPTSQGAPQQPAVPEEETGPRTGAPTAPEAAVEARSPEDETFFSTMDHTFGAARSQVQAGSGGGEGDGEEEIPTVMFLQACRCILPFLDRLGSTTFAPVRSDISGNIGKLEAAHASNPHRFITLQRMVQGEIDSKTTRKSGSATDALLWLKRALEFINELLHEVVIGNESLAAAAGLAYQKSLSRYHGWLVRQVFSVAMSSVPYRQNFLQALGPGDEVTVVGDMAEFTRDLGALLHILNTYYQRNGLDSSTKV